MQINVQKGETILNNDIGVENQNTNIYKNYLGLT